MIGLTDLEAYSFVLNITGGNNRFELYKIPDEKSGGVTYEKVREEIERDLEFLRYYTYRFRRRPNRSEYY